jgi:hypothetical protein
VMGRRPKESTLSRYLVCEISRFHAVSRYEVSRSWGLTPHTETTGLAATGCSYSSYSGYRYPLLATEGGSLTLVGINHVRHRESSQVASLVNFFFKKGVDRCNYSWVSANPAQATCRARAGLYVDKRGTNQPARKR